MFSISRNTRILCFVEAFWLVNVLRKCLGWSCCTVINLSAVLCSEWVNCTYRNMKTKRVFSVICVSQITREIIVCKLLPVLHNNKLNFLLARDYFEVFQISTPCWRLTKPWGEDESAICRYSIYALKIAFVFFNTHGNFFWNI